MTPDTLAALDSHGLDITDSCKPKYLICVTPLFFSSSSPFLLLPPALYVRPTYDVLVLEQAGGGPHRHADKPETERKWSEMRGVIKCKKPIERREQMGGVGFGE